MPFCKIECDDQRARSITEALTKNQSVLTQLDSLKFKNIAPEKAAVLANRLRKFIEQKESKVNQIKKLKSMIAEYERKNSRMKQFSDYAEPKINKEFWKRHQEHLLKKAARELTANALQ